MLEVADDDEQEAEAVADDDEQDRIRVRSVLRNYEEGVVGIPRDRSWGTTLLTALAYIHF